MVADVEAVDEIFADKFASGSQDEFLEKCKSSVATTQREMDLDIELKNFSGEIRSSSFFRVWKR